MFSTLFSPFQVQLAHLIHLNTAFFLATVSQHPFGEFALPAKKTNFHKI